MTKTINGNLILTEDTEYSEGIIVNGSIKGYFNLKVAGNINAWDIDAWDIDAWDINVWDINVWDINARNINARDISAWDINARDINAWDIICEKRIKKGKENKTTARIFIQNKSELERKEWE